ncbi:UNVERIFIED_CONTAM: hypothetical protein RMT77_015681 [Armadillidium vulgare]
MWIIYLTFVLLTITYTCTQPDESEKIKIVPGTIFNHVGQTKFVNGYVDLKLDLRSTKVIFDNLQELKDEITKIQRRLIERERNRPKTKRIERSINWKVDPNSPPRDIFGDLKGFGYTPKDGTASRSVRGSMTSARQVRKPDVLVIRHGYMLLAEIEKLIKDPWILSFKIQASRRTDRGLIDGAGKIFQAIFGTAVDSDVKHIRREIQILSDKDEGYNKAITQLRDQLKDTVSGVNKLFTQVGEIIDREREMEDYLHSIAYELMLNEFFSMVSTYLGNINQIRSQVNRIRDGAAAYRTPLDAYQVGDLIPIVHDASKELLLSAFVDIQNDPATFMKLTWSYLDLDHVYSLVTFIPLTNGEIFTTLEIHPFPTHINTDSPYRVTFTPENRIYFINKNKFLYTKTTHEQFQLCKTVVSTHACPLTNPIFTFDIPDCIVILYTNGSFSELHTLCEFEKIMSDDIITEHIRSYIFISVNTPKKGILHCGNHRPKETVLTDIFILKPRCTIRTSYHTFMNPVHVKYNSTLKLSIIDQRDLKLDLNVDNHVVQRVMNGTAHQKITGVLWNTALDHINDTLHTHQNSLNHLPPAAMSIGLSTFIFIAIGVLTAVCMYRRYKKLKSVLTTFNVTYEVPEVPERRDMYKRQRDIPRSVRRFAKAGNRIKNALSLNKNVRQSEDDDYLSMKDLELSPAPPTPMARNIDLKERISVAIAQSHVVNSPRTLRKLSDATSEPER